MSFTNQTNRYSTYSNQSGLPQQLPARASQQNLSSQVSTQTLLNALHTAYTTGIPYSLEPSTSLVANTWSAAVPGPDGRPTCTVDAEIANRAWEHARRRAEDGCIVLASLQESAPSTLVPFISALPFPVPSTVFTALAAVQPFLNCATPQNPSTARHSALAVTFTLALTGTVTGVSLKLSAGGLDTRSGLTSVPAREGYRAFDVFYYLLSSASSASEREVLGLKNSSNYTLLRKSGSYDPPSYLPTADDAAAAEEWRGNLKSIGITGNNRRNLVSVLAALLKLGDTSDYLADEEFVENTCEDAADLLGVDAGVLVQQCDSNDRILLVGAIYEALVDWVLAKANDAITREILHGRHASSADSGSRRSSRLGAMTPNTSVDGDTCSIAIMEIPSPQLGKAVAMKNIFDDTDGINSEMKADGVHFPAAGHSVITEMKTAVGEVEPELGILNGPAGRDWELQRDKRANMLEKLVAEISDEESIIKKLLLPIEGEGIALGHYNRFNVADVIGSSRVWFQLSVHPTDELPANIAENSLSWSASSPSRQLRAWRLPEWANRRNKQLDYTADFDYEEFCTRYARLGCLEGKDGIESFMLERGWSNGEIALGDTRVWVREGVWWEAETMLDMLPPPQVNDTMYGQMGGAYAIQHPEAGSGYFNSPFADNMTISQDNLAAAAQQSRPRSLAPTQAMTMRSVSGGDYGLGVKGDAKEGAISYYNELDPELADPKKVEEVPVTRGRRTWVALVWALTFWIPSPLLRAVGRMKRPDVRMAWREKFVLVFLIFLANATLVFYIIAFGKILCPNYDKAWNPEELATHQGDNDLYVAVYGRVYDISKFWKLDHSSGEGNTPPVQSSVMQQTAGQVVNAMFELPLDTYCAPLVTTGQGVELQYNSTNDQTLQQLFNHKSGDIAVYTQSSLNSSLWYPNTFLPRMTDYYKGDLVYDKKNVSQDGTDNSHEWFIINDQVYDLTNYFYTKKRMTNNNNYAYLNTKLEQMVQNNPGSDLTDNYNNWLASNASAARDNFNCLNNVFYLGKTDFRETARCQVNNYILLVFTCILCAVILIKFLSALQFGSKRRPSPQDKFVICHVPAYTEGEDDLRKGLDSLTALAYDNKRKLICVVCDGMIVGGGNDRPTPKIVLDILGVDPKIDPPALPFKSVGQGAEQLNYGKVYSGLYEFEGNVVPYIVIVKVGKESEQTKAKPGNRGKRDSQILLMSFLNRVHHRSPMSPLELEMFHQINNIIGVDPELYEYVFMVDADTMVKEDALTRLVASCADDSKIAGICGETSLRNEERSWTTMIQVYEYYISHHLAKAFESLFGSVTCLPGCFCMYRLRTVDKGKPLLISDKVIDEYSDCNVDTLHKKNLLSLGEDRYLTTLMTKHFPYMRYKFVPDAYAQTAAPESWSVLLSQRRRWINSTIHNLAELVWVKDMCGFCCFSMRFVVFIDLFGTIVLPATCAYLVYLIVIAATGKGQFPILSIIIIAAVYGLQAIIFILKRQWQHIGWMIIYIMAFPIYSLILPIYSFWKQDDFSWGNTRVVIGEKGNKQLVAVDDEGFDPRSIPLQAWDDYAAGNNLPGRRGAVQGEKGGMGYEDGYEMDDMRSVYSAARPASTVLTGFKSQQHAGFYQAPQSPAPLNGRQSVMRPSPGGFVPYQDQPSPGGYDPHGRLMSMGNMSEQALRQPVSPYGRAQSPAFRSNDNLLRQSQSGAATPLNRAGRQSPMPLAHSRPGSTINFQQSMGHGEASDAVITDAILACLANVNLDHMTKKSLKALVEQRLQMQLSTERRAFLDRQIDEELAKMLDEE